MRVGLDPVWVFVFSDCDEDDGPLWHGSVPLRRGLGSFWVFVFSDCDEDDGPLWLSAVSMRCGLDAVWVFVFSDCHNHDYEGSGGFAQVRQRSPEVRQVLFVSDRQVDVRHGAGLEANVQIVQANRHR